MFAIKQRLSEEFPAIADSVPLARTVVVDFAAQAGLTDVRMEALRLALSEAVTNVVRHAYPRGGGTVGVTANVAGDELWIRLSDTGVGHQAPSPNPGLGFGLAIIAHECDDLVVTERAAGGTELRMQFLLPSERRAHRGPGLGARV